MGGTTASRIVERLSDVSRGRIRNKSSDSDPTTTKKRTTGDDILKKLLRGLTILSKKRGSY
jgi:hypothetical protein